MSGGRAGDGGRGRILFICQAVTGRREGRRRMEEEGGGGG